MLILIVKTWTVYSYRGRKRANGPQGDVGCLINRLMESSVDNYRARKCNVPPVERAVGPNVSILRLKLSSTV